MASNLVGTAKEMKGGIEGEENTREERSSGYIFISQNREKMATPTRFWFVFYFKIFLSKKF